MEKFDKGTYNVKIVDARKEESLGGTRGVGLTFEHPACGRIEHTVWITRNTVERVERDFGAFGIAAEALYTKAFWADLPSSLNGHEGAIVLDFEEWRGKTRLKVQRMRKAASGSDADFATEMSELFTQAAKDAENPEFGEGTEFNVPPEADTAADGGEETFGEPEPKAKPKPKKKRK